MIKTTRLLWVLPLIWSLVGVFFIFESSVVLASRKYTDPFYFAKWQLVWLIISMIGFWAAARLKWEWWIKLAPWLFLGNLVFLILVFVPGLGVKAGGAYRWVNLYVGRFQPSELLKITLPLYLSVWLTKKPRSFGAFIILVLLGAGLVFLEPDMGTTLLIMAVSLVLYFIYHSNLKPFFVFSLVALVVSVVLILISPYRRQRLMTLLNPGQDKLGAAYQINQITIALGRGGLMGQGLGGSRQRFLFLPAASTDAILAVIGEEIGFIGVSLLLVSYLIFFSMMFKTAKQVKRADQSLFIYTAGVIVFLQMLINLGGMVVLLPLTGIPLPFVSYGGSSLASLWLLLGVAQSAVNAGIKR